MGRILVENVDSDGNPTVVGTQSDFRPLQLRWIAAFPILRITEDFKKQFRESPLPMGRNLAKNADFDGSPKVGGIQPDPPYNYDGFQLSQFYGLTELLKVIVQIATSDESHLGGAKRRFRGASTVGGIQ